MFPDHQPKICKTIEQAQDYARLIYPDLADVAFEIPRQGFEYFVLLTQDEAIRLPRREDTLPSMEREVETLRNLDGKLPCAIPVVNNYQADNQIMRTTRVPGSPLTRKVLAALPAKTQMDIARQIGAFAANLHKAIPAGPKIDYAEQFAAQASDKIRIMQSLGPDDDTRERLAMIDGRLHVGNESAPVFCHGDLQLPNILYDHETGKIGVVDFSKAGRNDARADLAMAYYYPEPVAEAVLCAYEEASGATLDREQLRLRYEAHVISCRKPQDLLESYRLFHQPQPSM